jgi:hypothetical protein
MCSMLGNDSSISTGSGSGTNHHTLSKRVTSCSLDNEQPTPRYTTVQYDALEVFETSAIMSAIAPSDNPQVSSLGSSISLFHCPPCNQSCQQFKRVWTDPHDPQRRRRRPTKRKSPSRSSTATPPNCRLQRGTEAGLLNMERMRHSQTRQL